MTEEEPPLSLENLGARLKAAQIKDSKRSNRQASHGEAGASMGIAMRIAVEMISALVVTGFIGWFLDQWLNTKPWLMLVMLLLGSVTGLFNTYRVAMRIHQKIEKEDVGDNDEKI